MNAFKVLGGIVGLSLLLGTGALAEIEGGEPGTSKNPDDNIPQSIQRSTPSGEEYPGDSGPGERSNALTKLKHEVPVKEGLTELEENVEETRSGAAALAVEELKQKELLQQQSLQNAQKGISTQSSKKGMKKPQ